ASVATFVENMVFIPYGAGNYYCYLSGSNLVGDYSLPTGKLMVKESVDAGVTFTDLSANFSATPFPYNERSHSKICVKPTDGSGNAQLFLYTIGTNWDFLYIDGNGIGNMEYIYTFTKNINTGIPSYPSNTNLTPSGAGSTGAWAGTPYRMGFDYDPINNGVWYGGVYLSFFDVTPDIGFKSGAHSSGGNVHYDIHDVQIKKYDNGTSLNTADDYYEIYVACDGGISRTNLNSPHSSVSFSPLNNGLNVNLINGFSGTDADENLYVIGGQDIVNSDVYDAETGKNRYTQPTWENDGAMIDKFNASNMFFDVSSYPLPSGNANYYASTNGGATLGLQKGFYAPSSNPTTFAQGSFLTEQNEGWFTTHLFCQDPYRPNRIYYSKQLNGACQFDYVSNTFVLKIDPTTAQPNYSSVTGTGDFNIRSEKKQSITVGFSFSPQTPNSMHITVGGFGNPSVPLPPGSALPSRPSILKYIGNNLDDCWKGHNEAYYTDGSGTHPQWATLTATLWENLATLPGCVSCNNLMGGTDPWLYTSLEFKDIETSPWNKDIVYVAMYMHNNPTIKVLKYDGASWSNYSNGIPDAEYPLSMIMDHQSKDAIYLSTDKAVYYRDANSTQWTLYSNGLPIIQSKQMEINYKENTVRAGTFGRGIYKSDLKCPADLPPKDGCINCNSPSDYYWEGNNVTVSNTTLNTYKHIIRAVNYIDILPNTTLDPTGNANVYYDLFIHGCSSPGNSYRSYQIIDKEEMEEEEEEKEKLSNAQIFPNPNSGMFTLNVEGDQLKNIYVYDLLGKVVYQKTETNEQQFNIDISDNPKGIYIIKVVDENTVKTLKVINQ
ncbi:MAG: T9SS type A sorting domain-containing protein, partial [Bacteroidetes bacterium]|nr:T9SS type A sorting domain-containing protein [Bacteroidota bacterium]